MLCVALLIQEKPIFFYTVGTNVNKESLLLFSYSQYGSPMREHPGKKSGGTAPGRDLTVQGLRILKLDLVIHLIFLFFFRSKDLLLCLKYVFHSIEEFYRAEGFCEKKVSPRLQPC